VRAGGRKGRIRVDTRGGSLAGVTTLGRGRITVYGASDEQGFEDAIRAFSDKEIRFRDSA
jgi:hypothetical protein